MSPSRRTLAFLVNPASGLGRGARYAPVALARLRAAGFTVRELAGGDAAGAEELAGTAVAAGVDGLVVCGGDGLVNVAAQAVAGTGVPLGIVPAGTGNDAARELGVPLDDPAGAADVVVASRTRTLDLGRVGGRRFVTVLAGGFDALVNERANRMTWPRGPMRYNVAIAAELGVFRPRTYTLDLDGAVRRVPAMLVAVGNTSSLGGGMRVTEGAVVDDGMLDVVVVKQISRTSLVLNFPKVRAGTLARHPAYEHHRVRRVTVAAPGITAYADGEPVGPLPLTVECEPGALRVFAPVVPA